MKLTAPQLAALQLYALPDGKRIRQGWTPRRDVVNRLAHLGLVAVRREWVHNGLTYRSKQRLAIVDVKVTDAGRQLIMNEEN